MVKRELTDESPSPSPSPSPAKKKSKKPSNGTSASPTKSKWSPAEEAKFLEAIDQLVKSGLWNAVKHDDELVKRGANGIRSHWDALYRKLKKG